MYAMNSEKQLHQFDSDFDGKKQTNSQYMKIHKCALSQHVNQFMQWKTNNTSQHSLSNIRVFTIQFLFI